VIWQAFARTLFESFVWLPARILAFAYIIVGNFSLGAKVFAEYLAAGVTYNQYILLRTVYVSLDKKTTEENLAVCDRLQRDTLILLLGVYGVLVILVWLI
jgi:membrane protein required for beta-lactamase induction